MVGGVNWRHGRSRRTYRRTVVDRRSIVAGVAPAQRRARATVAWPKGSAQRRLVDFALRCSLERFAGVFSALPDLPPALPSVGGERGITRHSRSARRGPARTRADRSLRVFYRRHVHRGEKRGASRGSHQAGQGHETHGSGRCFWSSSRRSTQRVASPAEVALVQTTLEALFRCSKTRTF